MRESFHRPFCIRFLWPNKVWGVRAFFFRKILFSTNPRRLSIIFVNLFSETFLMCFWILMKFFTRSDALLLLPQLFFFLFLFRPKATFFILFFKIAPEWKSLWLEWVFLKRKIGKSFLRMIVANFFCGVWFDILSLFFFLRFFLLIRS